MRKHLLGLISANIIICLRGVDWFIDTIQVNHKYDNNQQSLSGLIQLEAEPTICTLDRVNIRWTMNYSILNTITNNNESKVDNIGYGKNQNATLLPEKDAYLSSKTIQDPNFQSFPKLEFFWIVVIKSMDLEASDHFVGTKSYMPIIDHLRRTLQTNKTSFNGALHFRAKEHGSLTIFVMNEESKEIVSNLVQVQVKLCEDDYLLPLWNEVQIKLNETGGKLSKPSFEIESLLSISGMESIHIPLLTTVESAVGTWSLSFWLKLLEDYNGQYRAIFHKGDPNGIKTHRTPSAWLLPDANRFATRVSTTLHPDLGADTIRELKLNEWVHMAFTFENFSHSEIPNHDKSKPGIRVSRSGEMKETQGTWNDVQYRISVYVNGELDIAISYTDTVLGNDDPMVMFHDISHQGPKSFVRNLQIWSDCLTSSQIKNLYLQSHSIEPDPSIELLLHSNSPILPYILHHHSVVQNSLQLNTPSTSNLIDHLAFQRLSQHNSEKIQLLLENARVALVNCSSFHTRLTLYADAAELGSVDGLYKWGLMMKYGAESSQSSCGVTASKINGLHLLKGQNKFSQSMVEQEQAVWAMLIAADLGSIPALFELSMTLLTGFGMNSLFVPMVEDISTNWYIPLPSICKVQKELRRVGGSVQFANDGNDMEMVYLKPRLQLSLVEYLQGSIINESCTQSDQNGSGMKSWKSDVGASIMSCPNLKEENNFNPLTSQLAMSLIHLCSVYSHPEANVVLSYRYQHGIGVAKEVEVAALYGLRAAAVSSDSYHKVGGQPIVETDRINDKTVRELPKGNKGNDDELIQHHIVQAKEGSVSSMIDIGDLYYYGARGLPRDQPQALQYYEQAAGFGNPLGMCGAAAMHLKGEGVVQNISKAIALYENASTLGSIKALNGLGYIYFHGTVLPMNHTKAFQYFKTAANTLTDGDSLGNTGYCFEHGLGIEKDLAQAVQYYKLAAHRFGTFTAIKTLGTMYMEGKGVERSATEAMQYLTAVRDIGPWGGWIRRGLDHYLNEDYFYSLNSYLIAGELGYEVGQSNAAYLIRTKLYGLSSNDDQRLSNTQLVNTSMGLEESRNVTRYQISTQKLLKSLLWREYALSAFHGNSESALQMGNNYFLNTNKKTATSSFSSMMDLFQSSTIPKDEDLMHFDHNISQAMVWYYKASDGGMALASLYLGVIYHFNIHEDSQLCSKTTHTTSNGLCYHPHSDDYKIRKEYNKERARWYYELSLTQSEGNSRGPDYMLESQLKLMVRSFLYMLSWKDSSMMQPLNLGLDYVMRLLWGIKS